MNRTRLFRPATLILALLVSALFSRPSRADSKPGDAIPFTEETLPNGLRVIYAPLHQAPVVNVRVLYHVGSRDERPDRQGFAHMFEHMMFRGSKHVPAQAHMHLVDSFGGISNAFTSFDQTVYHDTVPAEDLETVLYLEADRMSSFKVSDDIYRTERNVVAEEWRLQQNRPYGNLYQDFLKTAFTTHSYRWTPIGNMQHLAAAPVSELQDFYNTYYLPNNAVLVIAGDFDPAVAKKMVQTYFAWVPRGPDIKRIAVPEPVQTAARTATVPDRVPLPDVMIGWHNPPYRSDDRYALSVLSAALGEGASSRLDRALVTGKSPLCLNAETVDFDLEDGGFFGVNGTVLSGKNPDDVERILKAAVADVVAHGLTDDELVKAKTLRRVETVQGRETAEDVGTQLGEEELLSGDAERVNQDLAKLEAVTSQQVQDVAKKYLQPIGATTLRVIPDPLGIGARKAAVVAASLIKKDAPVTPSTQPVAPRVVQFPNGYPEHPPLIPTRSTASFEKGTELNSSGVRVIVLPDHRLPMVNWTFTLRRGSHSDPAEKAGIANLTAEMLSRGAGKLNQQQFSEELESHGISLDVKDGGDYTRLEGSSLTDEVDRGFDRSRDLLCAPTFAADEFDKLKEQSLSGLLVAEENPGSVADQDMLVALFGGSPLGHPATSTTVAKITLDDVKQFYNTYYHPSDAYLIIGGDITVEKARLLADKLVAGWPPASLPPVEYNLPEPAQTKQITLVDRPDGKAATIRMGVRAYDLKSPQKFAGSLATTILSSGIESRLNAYVRAEKGYVYGVVGRFQPGRHAGAFLGTTETKLETTAPTIQAMNKVFDDVRKDGVTPTELDEAKRRVIGSLLMSMQTIEQQATLRADGILNGYPADYYDVYPTHIKAVTADQVRSVVNTYVNDGRMTYVVVAPAAQVKDQLATLGEVKVIPMPALRNGATTQPRDTNLLKSAK